MVRRCVLELLVNVHETLNVRAIVLHYNRCHIVARWAARCVWRSGRRDGCC
jgi:hypothetical protein